MANSARSSFKARIAALLGACLWLASTASGAVPRYRVVQQVGLALLRACPPEDCVLVFSGRSGTAVAAYLEALTGRPSIQVPLSDFRFNPRGPAGSAAGARADQMRALTEAEEAKLRLHFEEFIGMEELAGKRVMTVDYTQSGASHFSFTAYLNRWLESVGFGEEAIALPIMSSYRYETVAGHARDYGVTFSRVVDLGFFDDGAFSDQAYDSASAYGAYKIFEDPSRPTRADGPRPEYQALVREISGKQAKSGAVRRLKRSGFRSDARRSFRDWLKEAWRGLCGEILRPALPGGE